ncbi:hypothetical protein BDR26DRAFT_1008204 [Obelidium mucronatum]|nr:hypothetical protein BDR26DRAFT_1008204 [Obelidium mucronatum]
MQANFSNCDQQQEAFGNQVQSCPITAAKQRLAASGRLHGQSLPYSGNFDSQQECGFPVLNQLFQRGGLGGYSDQACEIPIVDQFQRGSYGTFNGGRQNFGTSSFKPWLNILNQNWHANTCDQDFFQGYPTRYSTIANNGFNGNGFNGNNFNDQTTTNYGNSFNNNYNNGIQSVRGYGIFGARNNNIFGARNNNIQQRYQSVKANIVSELVEDRQRDEHQANLIKQLTKKSSTTRNRMGLVQALLAGQKVPRAVIAQLLAEDFVMDHVAESIINKILADSVTNRNADHIIYDLASGNVHVPHYNQAAVERENFLFDQLTAKAAQRVTAPHANKRIVTVQAIGDVFDTLARAQQVGYNACVTPSGVEFGSCGGNAQGYGGQWGGNSQFGNQLGGIFAGGNAQQQWWC